MQLQFYKWFWMVVLLVLMGQTTASVLWAEGGNAETVRVSVASDGTQGNSFSYRPAVSGDGRWVVFPSFAWNLVPSDTNTAQDIFLHDRITGQTTRVSVASDGTQANGDSDFPRVSGDGRYIVFDSVATNLVPGDTNGQSDVYVHDRDTGLTGLVSAASDGTQGNHYSSWADISDDGRFVSFRSLANNLVPGDSYTPDIYVRDLVANTTIRVSVASDGTAANDTSEVGSISADGRYVSFQSLASNLIPNDTNGVPDIFVHDRITGMTTLVSKSTNGTQGNSPSWLAAVSGDGQRVVFESLADNLVPQDKNLRMDIFVHDLSTGTTTCVSVSSGGVQGNAESTTPDISADGRFVGYSSDASNLVAGDTNAERDIFLHSLDSGETTRVSVKSDGGQLNGYSYGTSLSNSGRSIAFLSHAGDVVPGDTNGVVDSFVHQTVGSPTAVSLTSLNSTPAAPMPLWIGLIGIGVVLAWIGCNRNRS
jgi:archaellum component FlaF (FlaF/FlaG flagellin family)